MKLLIADDHTLFRDALVQYIERFDPEAEVVLAQDYYNVKDRLDQGAHFDLVVLDVRMPGMRGVETVKSFKDTYADQKVALMSGVAERDEIQSFLDAGADGFFPKTMTGKDLLSAIQSLYSGQTYIPLEKGSDKIMPSYYSDLPKANSEADQKEIEALRKLRFSTREKEVLSYLVEGVSNKEIARALDIQVVTVKLHMRGICKKLNAQNRTQAALKARALGIKKAS